MLEFYKHKNMRTHNYSSFSDVTNLLSKSCICVEYKDINKEPFENEIENLDENVCDFDELEEVFADHLLMGKRLRKTLYAGNLNDLDETPDHPPIALTGLALEMFSKAVPNDGLDILDMDYASYTTEAASISPCAMIVAMIYLERLQLKNSEYLEIVSPSGLFVVTMLVASKFLFEDEDDMVTNQMWAEAVNFDVKELNSLERDFLSAIEWKVLVDSSDYFNFLCRVEKTIAIKQSALRGWLSYSDICAIVQDRAMEIFWTSCLKKVMKAMILWTVGYVATALTLHNAGIALCKLMQEKNELNSLVEINATVDLDSQLPGVENHLHPLLNLSHSEERNLLKNPLSSGAFAEWVAEENKRNTKLVEQDMCNLYALKRTTLPSNTKLSEILLIDKLKYSSNSYSSKELTRINNSYNLNIVHCRSNINCVSLLM